MGFLVVVFFFSFVWLVLFWAVVCFRLGFVLSWVFYFGPRFVLEFDLFCVLGFAFSWVCFGFCSGFGLFFWVLFWAMNYSGFRFVLNFVLDLDLFWICHVSFKYYF